VFGQNPTLKREEGDGASLSVHEIFHTIQGEGPHAGVPAVFIRLFGCHLKCTWCDTDFSTDNMMDVDDIIETVRTYDQKASYTVQLVVLTGGEPTRQPIDNLVHRLLRHHYIVQIETAGSFFRDCMTLPGCDTVVSPKNSFVHKDVASHARAYKYVISADMELDVDGLPITDTQGIGSYKTLAKPPILYNPEVYLSPMDEYDTEKNAANIRRVAELAMKHGYRMGVQMHKLVGLP